MCHEITKWYMSTCIYGDSSSIFFDVISQDSVLEASQKIAQKIQVYLNQMLKEENCQDVFFKIHNLITNCAPWPGYVKRPCNIDHVGDDGEFNIENLFKAYLLDTPEESRTLEDLMDLYYDDTYVYKKNFHEMKMTP